MPSNTTIVSKYHRNVKEDLENMQSLIKSILRNGVMTMRDSDFDDVLGLAKNTSKHVLQLREDLKDLKARAKKEEEKRKLQEKKESNKRI